MKKYILLCALLISACNDEIYYTKDTRTGLCFAKQYQQMAANGSISVSLATVDCKRVEGYIKE